ncbi:IS1 family transposase [Escherichia coli]
MVTVNLDCPRCQSVQVYRHGQNRKEHRFAAVTVTWYSLSGIVTSPNGS